MAMQQREEDSRPLGICHRLFRVLFSRFARRRPLPQVSSSEVAVEIVKGGQLQEEVPPVRDIPISNGKLFPRIMIGKPLPNINEKSDDFIQQRREAMQRTNTVEPKKF